MFNFLFLFFDLSHLRGETLRCLYETVLILVFFFSLFNRWKLGSGICSLMSDWDFFGGTRALGGQRLYGSWRGEKHTYLGACRDALTGEVTSPRPTCLQVCSGYPGSFPLYI